MTVPPPLTPKQARFVDEYVIDLNATQAAIRAGYSKKTANEQGARLLAKVSLAAEIQTRCAQRSAKLAIKAERVLLELARIAFLDPRKFYDETGRLRDPHALDDETAAALAGIEVEELFARGDDGRRRPIGQLRKIKWADKHAALVSLGRHLGLFLDRTQLEGDVVETLASMAAARTRVHDKLARLADRQRTPAGTMKAGR
jgi:phage terminase small subunit